MSFVNFPKTRIKKYPKGYVVEVQQTNWLGRKKWVHIISVSGIDRLPWYFSTYEFAQQEAEKFFKWCLLEHSNYE